MAPTLLAAAAAQHPPAAVPTDLPRPVPLHSAGDGAHWAAGADYKARFDGAGMRFYPVLGEDAPRNLPFGWCTESIGFEGAPRSFPGEVRDARRRGDLLFEIDRGSVREHYEIRTGGVEQLFQIDRPEGDFTGDLVVRGRITGPLTAADRGAEHSALVFRDQAGRAIVRYGAAFAIDAAGDVEPITTAFGGGTVALRVPAEWLRGARWPIVVDPLTSRDPSVAAGRTAASFPSLAHDEVHDRFLLSLARASSAVDWDVFAYVLDDRFQPLGLVYSDLTAASVRRSAVARIASPGRWVVAMQVETAGASDLRVYFHDTASLAPHSGSEVTRSGPGGHYSAPAVGGNAAGNVGYLVARFDVSPVPANVATSQVVGFVLNAANHTVGAQTVLSPAGNHHDADWPQIAPLSDALGWTVVWQRYDPAQPAKGWDVVGRRITGTGTAVGTPAVLLDSDDHELTPHVAGGSSRYLLTAVRRPNSFDKTTSVEGRLLVTRRFHWAPTNLPPLLSPVRQLDAAAADWVRLGLAKTPIAFDIASSSHWTVAWERSDLQELHAARLGYDGRIVENVTLQPHEPTGSFRAPVLCFDGGQQAAAAVYASDGVALGNPLFGRRVVPNGKAAASQYGSGCAGTIQADNRGQPRPWLGSEFFALELHGGRSAAPTWLLGGRAAGAWPLPFGPAGCQVLLDRTLMFPATLASGATDAAGWLRVEFPIPSTVPPVSLFWQFVQLDGSALYASNGMRTDVR